MKKAKTTRRSTTNSSAITENDLAVLDKLNRLYKRYSSARDKSFKFVTADGKAKSGYAAQKAKSDALANQIFELKACMKQPVKFNSVTGEYFYATGTTPATEKFIVRVVKLCTADIEVEASSFGQAEIFARDVAESGNILWNESYMPSGCIA